jgi:hypothetical protein
VIWLRATTVKGTILFNRALSSDGDPAATLRQAAELLTEAVDAAADTPAATDRAKAQATLGWTLTGLALVTTDELAVADLTARAETQLNAALKVYGPTSSPILWAWSLEGLAFASVACANKPACAAETERGTEASPRFAKAAEAYQAAGLLDDAARTLAMAEKHRIAP